MALVDEIVLRRDDCLKSLDAIHDYYAHTKRIWRLVQQEVRKGRTFTIRNQVTGSQADEKEIAGLAQRYITQYLPSATFQHFVSTFDQFLIDFIRAWLVQYPGSLSGKPLQFQAVLDAADKAEIVNAVAEKQVYDLGYKDLAAWFNYLEKIAKLGCPTKDQIEQLAEVKASRNVLVHNNGIVNSIYVDKSMGRARYADGDRLELPDKYLRESWELIKQVVEDVVTTAIQKI